MYRDYYDESDTWGLHNPYAHVPLSPDGHPRQRGMLLGLVGAGLAAALPITGRVPVPAPAPDPGLTMSQTGADVPAEQDIDDGGLL